LWINTFWLSSLLYYCIYRCLGLRRPSGTDRTCPATVPWTGTATLGTRRAPTNGDWARRWRQSPTGRQSSWTRTRRSTAATFSSSFAWKSHRTQGRCFRGNGAVAEEGGTTNLSHRWAAKSTRSSSKTSELKHYTIYRPENASISPAVPIRSLQNNITLSFRLRILFCVYGGVDTALLVQFHFPIFFFKTPLCCNPYNTYNISEAT